MSTRRADVVEGFKFVCSRTCFVALQLADLSFADDTMLHKVLRQHDDVVLRHLSRSVYDAMPPSLPFADHRRQSSSQHA